VSDTGTTIVTQTCPAPEHAEAFAAWQNETSRVVAGFRGFLRQTVLPPSLPTQVDWVILQHFTDRQSAVDWLRSEARLARVADVQALLVGRDDVHLVSGDGMGNGSSPVSAVISTRVKPGQETAYRQWEQRIAAAQAQAPGFQGYRLEPPIPGIQEDWLAVVKFDGNESLQSWLSSPERARLIVEAQPFTEEFHTRLARTGFEQWFDVTSGPSSKVPAWKQNMIVLLLLYPVVFLFGAFVQTPLLTGRGGIAFPVALFIGNVVSILLLNYLVPWASQRFGWWLQPSGGLSPKRLDIAGAVLIAGLYCMMVGAFTWLT
jgi:antibiotic biosynthesis monooxygenase (ABM) superfamily enzyme